jgi:MFS family permease
MTKSHEETKIAFIVTKLLNTPFWSLYCMLPIILYRDLHASAAMVAFSVAIKPLSSLLAPYWSAALNSYPRWLRTNVILAGILGHLPFLFTPLFDSPWWLIFAGALYMTLSRGATPAWMELLKIHMPADKRTPIFAWSSAFTYLGDALFAFICGSLLDGFSEAWRWLFPAAALIACSAAYWQYKLPWSPSPIAPKFSLAFVDRLKKPWSQAVHLLRNRPDFFRFQIGFALGGGGLMIIQGALPIFFVDNLKISYSEIGIALGFCKGVGFILATPIWARWFNRLDIFSFNGLVTATALAYPLLLFFAASDVIWLYLAYLCYGIMQGGSSIGWNLSGVAFAKEEESTRFTSVNVLMVGLRGFLAPLGGCICAIFSPDAVIALGAIFSLLATERLFSFSRKAAPSAAI